MWTLRRGSLVSLPLLVRSQSGLLDSFVVGAILALADRAATVTRLVKMTWENTAASSGCTSSDDLSLRASRFHGAKRRLKNPFFFVRTIFNHGGSLSSAIRRRQRGRTNPSARKATGLILRSAWLNVGMGSCEYGIRIWTRAGLDGQIGLDGSHVFCVANDLATSSTSIAVRLANADGYCLHHSRQRGGRRLLPSTVDFNSAVTAVAEGLRETEGDPAAGCRAYVRNSIIIATPQRRTPT